MATRKYVRILVVFACIGGMLLAAAGCRKKPQPPSTPTVTPTGDEPPAVTPTDDQPPATAPTNETPSTPAVTDIPPAVSEASDDQTQIVPLAGVGPVKFRMSKEQVMEVFGQPERMEGGGVALYYLTSKGVSVLIDPRRGVRGIDCWSADYPNPFPGMVTFVGKTDKGIGMGASRAQIVAAYGEPDGTSSGALETLRYHQLGMNFVLAQGSLVNLKIMAPD